MVKKNKSVKRANIKLKALEKKDKRKKAINRNLMLLFNILVIAIFVLGLYKIFFEFDSSWRSGLFIIVLDLIFVLILKLYIKIKK
ncbi:MAG TPA: hypothetical protein P5277_02670 [Candidatus Paceibacterota bacterium]|nr:hypothetical protein [Candidatus Paceibacterota bacterium]